LKAKLCKNEINAAAPAAFKAESGTLVFDPRSQLQILNASPFLVCRVHATKHATPHEAVFKHLFLPVRPIQARGCSSSSWQQRQEDGRGIVVVLLHGFGRRYQKVGAHVTSWAAPPQASSPPWKGYITVPTRHQISRTGQL
jgi:hypothetical protein